MYFDAIYLGLIYGLTISALALGPSFFLIMETSIKEGWKPAFFIDLGIIASDALCMYLAYKGASNLLGNLNSNYYFFFVGGLIFVVYGIFKLAKRDKNITSFEEIKQKSFLKAFFTGFSVNIMNPGVVIYWFTIVSVGIAQLTTQADVPKDDIKWVAGVFTLVILACILAIDLLKIFFARVIKRFLSPKVLYRLETGTALIFLGAGIFVVLKSYNLFMTTYFNFDINDVYRVLKLMLLS